MPAISTPSKILVSGANGYIAIWVVRTLLERGHTVRGTVRTAAKGKHLVELFKSYGDKFELAVVDDITKEGAFDEAVSGVDAIAHTASPFYMNAVEPQELIDPAVKGTVGILQSTLKHGAGVKRVVVISSCASVLELGTAKHKVFTELDWNDEAVREVSEQGAAATGAAKYRASKTLAEKAAWAFHDKHKDSVGWDLVVLNPPFVFGPLIHDVPDIASLNTSSRQWYDTVLVPGSKSDDVLTTQGSAWVDVRDLGEAHARAFEKEEASGQRIIVSAGTYVWQDWIDAAHALKPSPVPVERLAVGVPGAGLTAAPPIRYDTTKEKRILGIKHRTREELTRDTLADFQERGW